MVVTHKFYEEGPYTATLTKTTSGTITLNTSWNKLGYTRIGNKVHVHGNIIVSSVSSFFLNVALNLPYETNITQTIMVHLDKQEDWYFTTPLIGLNSPMFIDGNDLIGYSTISRFIEQLMVCTTKR